MNVLVAKHTLGRMGAFADARRLSMTTGYDRLRDELDVSSDGMVDNVAPCSLPCTPCFRWKCVSKLTCDQRVSWGRGGGGGVLTIWKAAASGGEMKRDITGLSGAEKYVCLVCVFFSPICTHTFGITHHIHY